MSLGNFDPGTIHDGLRGRRLFGCLTVAAFASFSTADTIAVDIAALDDDRRFAALRTERGAGCLALAECVYVAVGGARGQPGPDRTDERRDRGWPLSMDVTGRRRHLRPPGRMDRDGLRHRQELRQRISNFDYMPGIPDQVTHVYADACKSEGRLEPVDPLDGNSNLDVPGPREPGRHRGRDEWFNGPEGLPIRRSANGGDPRGTGPRPFHVPVWSGWPAADLGRSGGNDLLRARTRPLGRGIYFGQDGTPFVFTADFGPDATDADADEVGAIVKPFELSSR